jgi:hypothetical protein
MPSHGIEPWILSCHSYTSDTHYPCAIRAIYTPLLITEMRVDTNDVNFGCPKYNPPFKSDLLVLWNTLRPDYGRRYIQTAVFLMGGFRGVNDRLTLFEMRKQIYQS